MKTKACEKCKRSYIPTGTHQQYCIQCGVLAHKEKAKEYYNTHLKQVKQWRKAYLEQGRLCEKTYLQTPKGKITSSRGWNKRQRNLGFYPLNEPSEGNVFHHLGKERGLYIPEVLHRSISHCLETGTGMKEINLAAIDYWVTMAFKHLKEQLDARKVLQ